MALVLQPLLMGQLLAYRLAAGRTPSSGAEYLTEAEVKKLIAAAPANRYGHRDSTLILLATVTALGRRTRSLQVGRVDSFTGGFTSPGEERRARRPPLNGPELRALRRLKREQRPASPSWRRRSRAPVQHGGVPADAGPAWAGGRLRVPGSPAGCAMPAFLLLANGDRHALAAGIPRAQEHRPHVVTPNWLRRPATSGRTEEKKMTKKKPPLVPPAYKRAPTAPRSWRGRSRSRRCRLLRRLRTIPPRRVRRRLVLSPRMRDVDCFEHRGKLFAIVSFQYRRSRPRRGVPARSLSIGLR